LIDKAVRSIINLTFHAAWLAYVSSLLPWEYFFVFQGNDLLHFVLSVGKITERNTITSGLGRRRR